jgi:ubiquinone/menaquinone biosynthesis C-methylase UbiE
VDQHAQVKQEFGRQAEAMATAPAFTRRDSWERIKEALGPAAGGRILDLACGPGIVTAALAPTAREVVGYDLTPEMLAQARRRCEAAGVTNVRFEQGAAESLPFPRAEFDAVVTRATIHHFPAPALVFAEMARALRPGGRVVVADIVTSPDPEDAALHNALEILRDPSHVRMLTADELLAFVQGAGLDVLARARWTERRRFAEWAAIVRDPARTGPLRTVMRSLARSGLEAGIGLSDGPDDIEFDHHWILVTATRA